MLGAKSLDELLVGVLVAVLVENAHMGLTTVKSLGRLAETTGKTVVDESLAKDTLEGLLDRHLSLGGGTTLNFDLLGGLNLGDLLHTHKSIAVQGPKFADSRDFEVGGGGKHTSSPASDIFDELVFGGGRVVKRVVFGGPRGSSLCLVRVEEAAGL